MDTERRKCDELGCKQEGPVVNGKAACLRHCLKIFTLAERRSLAGLHPHVPPPGIRYKETDGN